MAERSVRVRLTAVVADFKRAMEDARGSVEGVTTATKGAEQESGKLSQAGRAIGSGMVKAAAAATVAVAGLGVGALKTGIAYNTLEQSSQAALTTLLGSSQAATEQMEKLREFGKTSPFPRQVWIEAQQQLLAFGFAAEDIIPTFSAIQDAVAAAGGSATDIQEIVRVLAQVQSTGKVSAETLNQLGVRGIDAASLLGQAMGKTAQQIREDISSGALDAATFIEMLTQTMTDRFGGAADGLKNTWVGAVDRIKGAFRDIGSALAEPFIAKAGGGAAVQWANSVADIMRALEAQILAVMTAMGPSFEGRFASLNDGLQRVAEAIRNIDLATLTSWAERLGPALASSAGGLLAFSTRALPVVGAVNPLLGAFSGLLVASPELRGALLDVLKALTPLLDPAAQLATLLASAMTPAVAAVASAISPLANALGGLVSAFTSLPGPVQVIIAALAGLAALSGPLGDFNDLMFSIPERLSRLPAKLGEATGSIGGFRGAMSGLLSVFGGPWGLAVGGATIALGAFASKNAETKQAIEEVRGTLDDQTGAITENTIAWAINKFEQDGTLDKYRELGGNVADLSGYMAGNEDAIRRVNGVLGSHREEFSTTVSGYAAGGEAVAVTGSRLTGTALEVYDALYTTNGVVAEGVEAQRLIAEAMGGTATEQSELQAALDSGATVAIAGYGEVVDGATWSTKDLTAAMDQLIVKAFGQEEAADANSAAILRWKEEIDRARDAEDKLSFSLEGNSLEAIDNRAKIRDLVGGVQNMIVADLEAGMTKDEAKEKARQYKKQLEDELVQMGFNRAEVLRYTGQVDGMVDSIDEIPDRAGVDVYVTGDGVAIAKINALSGVIQGLKDKTVKLTALGISASDPRNNQAFASGGSVFGPGSETSDSIPALLSNNEHVWSAREVHGAGGHGNVERLRAMARHGDLPAFAAGGAVARRLHVDVDSDRFPAASYWETQFGRLIESVSDELRKRMPTFLGSGRVLPRGSYRVGMPYLGYPGHYGADYPAPVGTPVAAVADGFVKRALSLATSYGKHIFLGHGARESRYAHLSSLLVGAGQSVKAGQIIGRVGSTGNSTGPHLHYEDRINGRPRNPAGLGIFDRGGYLMPGQYGVNLTDTPERVLSPAETRTFDTITRNEGLRSSSAARLAAVMQGGSRETVNHFHLNGAEVAESARRYAREVTTQQMRAAALELRVG